MYPCLSAAASPDVGCECLACDVTHPRQLCMRGVYVFEKHMFTCICEVCVCVCVWRGGGGGGGRGVHVCV